MSAASDVLGSGAKPWVSGKTYKQGAVVLSPADNNQAYVRIGATGAGATDPASDTTNYRPFGGRAIKSIQRGEITITTGQPSGTATISSVITAKAVLTALGGIGFVGTNSDVARLSLTNATTVTATIRGNAGSNCLFGYQVVEYY